MLEELRKQELANWAARSEQRDSLRREQKRRAAGIAPRGAQEALEQATGCRNESGTLTELQ